MKCPIFNCEKTLSKSKQVIKWQLNERVRKKPTKHNMTNHIILPFVLSKRFFPLHNTDFSNSSVILNFPLSSFNTSITDEEHLPHASVKLLTASRTLKKE